jgi:hypothetical protein
MAPRESWQVRFPRAHRQKSAQSSSRCRVRTGTASKREQWQQEVHHVRTELRSGLVEVPGGLPTFASEGLEARAIAIGSIAADSYDYLADLLGFLPEAQVLVLSEADWASKSDVPIYGLPNAGDGTLTVAGTDASLWSEVGSMVADEDRAELEAAYRAPDGSVAFGPFWDLVAVHEVAHLFHLGPVHFPRLWLQELFANLCLHAWVEQRAPASRATLLTLPRLGAKAPPEAFVYRTGDDFERVYTSMPGPNYAWLQFRLQMAAAALYDSAGEPSVARLFNAFRLDEEALATLLGDAVDPTLASFARTF